MLTCGLWSALLVPLALMAAKGEREKTACQRQQGSFEGCRERVRNHWPAVPAVPAAPAAPDPLPHSAGTCSFRHRSHCQYRQGCTNSGAPLWRQPPATTHGHYTEVRPESTWPSGTYSVLETPLMTVPHPSCLSFTASVHHPVFLDVLLWSAKNKFCTLKLKWTNHDETIIDIVQKNIPGGKEKIVFRGKGGGGSQGFARLHNVSLTEGCCPHSTSFSTFMSNNKSRSSFTDCDWEHSDQWEVAPVREKRVQTKGSRATLTTPPLQWPYPGRPGCVTFSFHIPDNAQGSLVVSTVLTSRDRQHLQHVWSVATTEARNSVFAGNKFASAQLPVTLTWKDDEQNLRLQIRFTADRQGRLPIALGDVQYTAVPNSPCQFLPPGSEVEGVEDNDDDSEEIDGAEDGEGGGDENGVEDNDDDSEEIDGAEDGGEGGDENAESPDLGGNALSGIDLTLIVIVVSVVDVALLCAGFWVWKRKKGRSSESQRESTRPLSGPSGPSCVHEGQMRTAPPGPGGPPPALSNNYSEVHDILQHGTVTSNYDVVDEVTNGNYAVPMAEGAGPEVTSPQDDDGTYNRLNLSRRGGTVPSGDPLRHRGPKVEDYDRLRDVVPGGPPQAASTAKKEGASTSSDYCQVQADGQLSEEAYDRLGVVKGSRPPPKAGGATPHGAYDHVTLANEEGTYDVAQIDQRKKTDVIDSDYHQIGDFSKGE